MQFDWSLIFYFLGVYGLTRFLVKYTNNNENHRVTWTPLESVGVTIFIYFFGQLIGSLLAYSLPLLWGWNSQRIVNWMSDDAIGQFITIALVELVSIYFLYKFLKKRKSNFSLIGLTKKVKLSDFGHALIWFIVYLFTYLLLLKVVSELVPSIDIDQKQEIGFNAVKNWQLPFVFTSLVILPPLVEEIIMRGFLYTGLKNKLPKLWAILITSGLFAVAHLQAGSGNKLLWVAAIDTFILSFYLIHLREKTGRLWAPIFLHGLKNLIAFFAIFIFKVG